MNMGVRVVVACAAAGAGLFVTNRLAHAETPAGEGAWLVGDALTERMAYALDTGEVRLERGAIVRRVIVPGAASVRVHFGDTRIPAGTQLRIVSVQDGDEQRFDQAQLEAWGWSSAYFNGDALDVILEPLPAKRGATRATKAVDARALARLAIHEVEFTPVFGTRGDPGACGICGTDDRTPSQEPWSGRLVPGGCSAFVICEDNAVLTAGHCTGNTILQFNVPLNTPTCQSVAPLAADQFPVTVAASSLGGGSDWAILRAGVNTLGQTPWDRYRAKIPVSLVAPEVGDECSVVGYGWDNDCVRRMTQQVSPGAIVATGESITTFTSDVRSVSSGSPLIVDGAAVAIVTTCSACANGGTSVRQTGLSSALGQHVACRSPAQVMVTSQLAGVNVTIEPLDAGMQGGGPVPLTRTYMAGTPITVTAPANVGAACFVQWRVGQSTYVASRTLQHVVGLHATTMEAVYAQPPAIVEPPAATGACVGTEVLLDVVAMPTSFVSFQWRRNGVPITGNDNPGRRYFGMTTRELRITNAQTTDTGLFDVVVTTPCGSVTSVAAQLTVTTDCQNVCDTIDFNRDGIFPDANDLDVFLHVLAGGSCRDFPGGGVGGESCGDVDFNNDGLSPDALDLDAFISRLAGGPCL